MVSGSADMTVSSGIFSGLFGLNFSVLNSPALSFGFSKKGGEKTNRNVVKYAVWQCMTLNKPTVHVKHECLFFTSTVLEVAEVEEASMSLMALRARTLAHSKALLSARMWVWVLAVSGMFQPTCLHAGDNPASLPPRALLCGVVGALRGGAGGSASDVFAEGRVSSGNFGESGATNTGRATGSTACIDVDAVPKDEEHGATVFKKNPRTKDEGDTGNQGGATEDREYAHNIGKVNILNSRVHGLAMPMPAAQIGSSVGGASYNTWFTSDNADINVADGRVAARKGIIGASASAMGGERRRKRRLMNNSPDTYFKTVLSVDPSDVDTMCECRDAY